jgi:hypothetical protein
MTTDRQWCLLLGDVRTRDDGCLRSAYEPKGTSYGHTMGFFGVRLRLSLHD